MRLFAFLLLFTLLSLALADTEIVNVRIPLPPSDLVGVKLTRLEAGRRHTHTLSSNDSETYFFAALDPGGWTARISWPASTPTRFTITPHGHADGAVFHVRASALAPRVPYFNPEGLADSDFETTFHILVEPLLLGVLPRTAVSAFGAIAVCVAIAAFLAPRFLAGLHGLVRHLDEEPTKDE
ncbi:hypothetical protein CC85DRAFT_299043 [Cutaneotrichosporon oleaginosum]|uniref:ER membrane protein complex subunit 7 beta-sandwich domain-containing protein n=1 Tax=Cutaneotrichosporon oleaginosum TaxID=879819 RepID=A0A0J0XXQ1_9TREE|nr:uncharacterized protein CC85DRAFT_299043 [Cutaneotrichosporon oleaginosum]KLT45855.1 hypothetical protein CC85DRAFT_299043 [Cutaneotrichosporon oleaginosum]TXT06558.1 hypothetical protein COLE_05889 [Cutaneotrichosporon oleaginosum]